MKATIEDLFRIDIMHLKNAGCFECRTRRGELTITKPGSRMTASFHIDTTARSMLISSHYGNIDIPTMVRLIKKPTNLGIGHIWLFECPVTHHPCRNLYCINGKFVSRWALVGIYYRQQLQGRKDRFFTKYHRYSHPPVKPYGKEAYRGKVTPYGKRVEKYDRIFWKMEDQLEVMVGAWADRDDSQEQYNE